MISLDHEDWGNLMELLIDKWTFDVGFGHFGDKDCVVS